jgi:hypothetical protein
MKLRWKKERDSVEAALLDARPTASDEFVGGLSERAFATNVKRSGHGSRFAFAAALTVFMLGTFASFGGLSYAASSAQTTASAVHRIVAPVKVERTHRSSASTQYGEQSVLTPPVAKAKKPDPTVRVAAAKAGSPPQSGTLPFTGYGLGMTAAIGSLLLALGVFLRRRESRA